ncbi:MAG: hypothetical protein ACOX7R_02755 [Acetivibrionales bacterium]
MSGFFGGVLGKSDDYDCSNGKYRWMGVMQGLFPALVKLCS